MSDPCPCRAAQWAAARPAPDRARARLSLPGRRLVALTGRPAGVQVRNRAKGDGSGSWVDATWPIDTLDAAVLDVLSLGAEVEIVGPADLRGHGGRGGAAHRRAALARTGQPLIEVAGSSQVIRVPDGSAVASRSDDALPSTWVTMVRRAKTPP